MSFCGDLRSLSGTREVENALAELDAEARAIGSEGGLRER